MDEQPVTYDGMEAVPLNEPVIDFIGDDGQVLDLHNGGRVVRIEIEMPANLVVRLTYIEPARWAAEAEPEREVELRFGGVRNLTVVQEQDSPDAASSTFEDLTAWPSSSPKFMLRTGNLELRFDASRFCDSGTAVRWSRSGKATATMFGGRTTFTASDALG